MSFEQLAHASFTIAGDLVVPEFWTRYFGVSPDLAISKGDPVADPTGQGRVLTRRTGVWGVKSRSAVRSDVLTPHLRYLVEKLRLPRDDLPGLVTQAGAEMRFFCYWRNDTGTRVPDIPDDLRTMMASSGGFIEIDEYR